MDRIYKIGGHCFALPDERLMEAVDGISGFKPFVWQPDLVSAKDVYEGAWLPDFTVWEGNGWGFPAFQRKSYDQIYGELIPPKKRIPSLVMVSAITLAFLL